MNTSEFIFSSEQKTVENFSVTWQTPSNIALVKYWGKKDIQIPKNTSISFTLNNSTTTTNIQFKRKAKNNDITFELFFEGKKKDSFKPKIAKFLERILKYCPYLLDYNLTIFSKNSFPHSSGIASSASGMSAIALCVMSLERALNPKLTNPYFNKKASFLARLGSGSASRSIEGPLVIWGNHTEIKGSSNLFGLSLSENIHPVFKNYQDTILLVDKGEKQVSSTIGHNLMYHHPYAENRFKQANKNVAQLIKILQNGNLKEFTHLVESEALTLHAMMLTSNPYFILLKPNTLHIINKIWDYRNKTQSNLCFTLDAGANVHVLFPEEEREMVLKFIKKELLQYCQHKQFIIDFVGFGAKKL